MTPTDTSEKGLEILIVRRLIGQAQVPTLAPEGALVWKEALASYGGADYVEGDPKSRVPLRLRKEHGDSDRHPVCSGFGCAFEASAR